MPPVCAEQVPGSKIITITGSNGKTTTTALTAHPAERVGVSAVACGNVSPSALDALMDARDAGTQGRTAKFSKWPGYPVSSSETTHP
ncbi:MAG: hypothetical protein IPP59_03510 [Betaproteobacteria bacterium]|nr:hypothetical protein [Candidatus Dechloromonas phosphorivorans]